MNVGISKNIAITCPYSPLIKTRKINITIADFQLSTRQAKPTNWLGGRIAKVSTHPSTALNIYGPTQFLLSKLDILMSHP